ncbi:hypothetical protein AGMMS49975_13890 [Clostridia bacterium]|nr:hypothetical protein AGMMS49975_13890 [Clostridia bacterium]
MDTVHNQIYEKLSKEFNVFLDNLKSKTPNEIIGCAYESVFKSEILACFEDSSLNEKEASALLMIDAPLNEIYQDWLGAGVSYMDDLRDCIFGTAIREID